MISTNQVMQLYVVDSAPTIKSFKKYASTDASELGILQVDGADGKLRSDIIDATKIMGVSYTAAEEDKTFLKCAQIKLNPNVNGGLPVAGQHYVLTLNFRGFVGNEDTYQKFADVYVDSTIATAEDFYQALATSLLKNCTEVSPLFTMEDASGQSITLENVADRDYTDGFYIYEADPRNNWKLGQIRAYPSIIELSTSSIILNADEVNKWLDDESYEFVDSDISISNSCKIADLEHFAMGERGAQNNKAGWPYALETTYKVDPKDPDGYNVLTVHYYFDGHNHAVQKSEKDLILVSNKVSLAQLAQDFNDAKEQGYFEKFS